MPKRRGCDQRLYTNLTVLIECRNETLNSTDSICLGEMLHDLKHFELLKFNECYLMRCIDLEQLTVASLHLRV